MPEWGWDPVGRSRTRIVEFEPRFVPRYLLNDLSTLWRLSATARSGGTRHDRLVWTARAFHDAHPSISSTAAYKDLYDMLDFGGR